MRQEVGNSMKHGGNSTHCDVRAPGDGRGGIAAVDAEMTALRSAKISIDRRSTFRVSSHKVSGWWQVQSNTVAKRLQSCIGRPMAVAETEFALFRSRILS